ncbi:MAG: 2,3-bisphosphoglycerate-independent phosphoglycerate mutase [Thiohalocapsa sp.]|jgi:2,3-bisphosphoglycerate-independent phosphoglycerate mutase|uniref:2,3-bisphosphoglycerate-independent phosphoglycerate mutase n=1 Tax=Thiohalocapsa sp. TaxID=2497641 RepID=UPI0025F1145F|nr:2,3-bisphosphoglycerate-independent phosphoglycerate mutase [Thiohalocapsa sp.]
MSESDATPTPATTRPAKPAVLVILDGVGVNPSKLNNAVAQAQTPRLDEYFYRYPFTVLNASGGGVGLPDGQMGNSEVGHMTLGSGCTVRQDLVLIDDAVANGSFHANAALLAAADAAKAARRPLHLLGLVSNGGVHSHVRHLMALIELCRRRGAKPLLHMITDGRDTPPKSALNELSELEQALDAAGGGFATVSGRYYAMDRDRRWERTERAWRAIVLGKGRGAADARGAINAAYAAGETDEFIQPSVINGYRGLEPDDPLVLFNFRKDRPRQIAAALALTDFEGFDRGGAPKAAITCMMQYDKGFGLPYAFTPDAPAVALNRYLSGLGIKQFHCAETEKYAHVTFFFNSGVEEPADGETHRLIPSPAVRTYDMKPEMSAPQVANAVVEAIEGGQYGFIVVNFANGDMVGHTGDMGAAVRAMEAVDTQVGRVLDAAVAAGYAVLLTADHGNCDMMMDPETDEPHTQHTTHPVPLLVVDQQRWLLAPSGTLADVAPSLLTLMDLPIPDAMTGRSVLLEALPAQPAVVLEDRMAKAG